MAASTSYLMIDGIAGTSTNPDFPNAIEVLSYTFGTLSSATKPQTTDAQKPVVTELHFVKASDSASATLAQAASSGQPFKSAVLTTVSADHATMLKFTMTDVLVASDHLSGRGESPTEAVTLVFEGAESIFGAVPPPHTTVQPDHQHLINHLKFLTQHGLRKP